MNVTNHFLEFQALQEPKDFFMNDISIELISIISTNHRARYSIIVTFLYSVHSGTI